MQGPASTASDTIVSRSGHSIGKEPGVAFVTTFYDSIFADDTTDDAVQFRNANVSTMEMHTKAQSAYWIDAFGGDRVYWGGHARLGFHHSSQHAERVMTPQGPVDE